MLTRYQTRACPPLQSPCCSFDVTLEFDFSFFNEPGKERVNELPERMNGTVPSETETSADWLKAARMLLPDDGCQLHLSAYGHLEIH